MISKEQPTVLLADDDLEDCELIREAWREAKILAPLRMVHNGEDLLAYLRNEGKFDNANKYPRPALIFLDLNMPKWDGREALREIKTDSKLRTIPIIILTTSQSEEDILGAYSLGANSFICKPPSFTDLVTAISTTHFYWFEVLCLPGPVELQI